MLRRLVPGIVFCIFLSAVAQVRAEDQFFDSNGVKIRYRVDGKGEPVVLIHGFAANASFQWTVPGVTGALAKDYQVITFDNRGHGKSDKPHDAKMYGKEMEEDVIRLLDHLKIDKAHIVGYSMGGFMTIKLLASHPERMLSATTGGAGYSKDLDEKFMNELADSLDTGKGIGPLLIRLTPEGDPKPTEEQLQAINKLLLSINDTKALAAVIRGMKGLAVTEDDLKNSKVPILALIGDKDPLKKGVDEMKVHTPDLEVIEIKGADHMNAFGRPEFIKGLKDFLAKHSQTRNGKKVEVQSKKG
jgi:pimeloyl-ACP methyl ester carboxylesterase